MAASRTPKVPTGVGSAGARLWRAVVGEFDLDEPERMLLVEAVRVADRLADLDAAIRRDGTVVDGRPNRCIAEARQQQLVLTRLIASLRLPDEQDDRPQHRGAARGAYGIKGAV